MYATAIAINLTFYWQLIKKKTLHLLENASVAILDLWKRNYNSKISPKATVSLFVASTKKQSTFENFLQADKHFTLFDTTSLID